MAWGGYFGYRGYILRCGRDPAHSDFERPQVATRGNTPDITGWKLPKARRKEMVSEVGEERTRRVMRYEGKAALSKEEARDIVMTLWPRAPAVEVKKAMLLCVQNGLNPLMKHLFLLPFTDKKTGEITWVLALSIKANRLLARRQGPYSYVDNTPRVMTDDEQVIINGHVDDNNIWFITKLRDPQGNEAQGCGNWPKGKAVYGADVGNTPQNMAGIRSERVALERLKPGAVPMGVAVVDERFVSHIHPDDVTGPEPEFSVEAQEGLATALTEGTATEEGEQPHTEKKHDPADDVKPEDVPDLHSLERKAWTLWQKQPASVYKLLGYSSKGDVTQSPWQCFLQLREIMKAP